MYKKIAALIIATVVISSTAFGQMYKADYATKLVLAGTGGPGLPNTITFVAPTIGADQTYTWPTTTGSAGYVLKTNGSGTMDWVNLNTLGITSVVGTSPINVNTITGVATVSIDHSDLLVSGAGLSVTSGTGRVVGLGDATISLATGNLTAGSNALSIGGNGTNAVVGTGASVILTTNSTLEQSGGNLHIKLDNSNAWAATQTFMTDADQSDAFVASINGGGTSIINTTHGGTNSGAAIVGSSIMVGTGGAIVQGPVGTLTTVLHGNASGVPAYSSIVDADIANTTITNGKLVNSSIGLASSDLSLVAPGTINLGDNVDITLDVTHDNNWNSNQTITGAGHQLKVDASADFVLDGHNMADGYVMTSDVNGVATWTDLSSVGVTSIQGTTDQVLVNGDNLVHAGAVVLTTPQAIAPTSSVTFANITDNGLAASSPVRSNGLKQLVSGKIDLQNDVTDITGTLPVAYGGTGTTGFTGNQIVIANVAGDGLISGGTGAITTVLHGGAAGAPTYSQIVDADITTATITNAKLATPTFNVSSTDASLTVPGSSTQIGGTQNVQINTAHGNNWSGTQTFGATGNNAGTITLANADPTPNDDVTLGSSNTLYTVSTASNSTLTGLSDGFAGRIMTIVNTGSSYIHIPNQGTSSVGNQFLIAGGDDIYLGPNGTATFMYVGGNWTLVSGF